MNDSYLILIFLIIVIVPSLGIMIYLSYLNQKKFVESIKEHGGKVVEIPPISYSEPKEIFVTFPCGNCAEQIVVEDFLMPGDIHVIDCENCQTSWSIYNPSLVIKQTKDLPDSLKTAVAQNMAELHA